MTYDHQQSPRLGQPTTVESTQVRMFTGEEIPEAAWVGQVIYRTDTQILQVYNGEAWEDVVAGDLGVFTYVGPTIPVSHMIGDIWFDSDDFYKMYLSAAVGSSEISPSEWVLVQNSAGALAAAAAAQAAADLKTTTFRQETPPTATTVGDLWVDTDADNLMYRAESVGADAIADGEWVLIISPPEPYVDPYTGVISLPTPDAEIQDARIFARLEANEVIVNDNLRILGENNFIDGSLVMGDGVRRPASPPTVSQITTPPWDSSAEAVGGTGPITELPTVFSESGAEDRIMALDLDGDIWTVLYKYSLNAIRQYELQLDGSYLEINSIQPTNTTASVRPVSFTRIDGYFYVVCTDGTTATVKVYNLSWVYQTSMALSSLSTQGQWNIDNDGGFLYVFYRNVSGSTYSWRVVKKTLSGSGASTTMATSAGYTSHLIIDASVSSLHTVNGFYVGEADFGSPTMIVYSNQTAEVYNLIYGYDFEEVGTPSATRNGSKDWRRWTYGMGSGGGLFWDPIGERFHAGDVYGIVNYGKNTIIMADYEFEYVWHKSTGEETLPSDGILYTAPKRSWVEVITGNPQAPADSVAIYIANNRQPDVSIGTQTVMYDAEYAWVGDPHDGLNGFNALVGEGAGSLNSTGADLSEAPYIELMGTGSWRLGHLKGNDDGTNAMKTSWITATMQNSFTPWDVGSDVKYRRVDNIVEVQGAISPSSGNLTTVSGSSGIAFMTLPVGYRMASVVEGGRSFRCSASGDNTWAATIIENGVIQAERYGPDAPTTGSWMNVNIMFITDDEFP